MSATETTSVETTPSTASPSGRPWSPTDRDRLIYHWVKFDGHKQSWVAQQLNLNQSTVSRIVDRYERWIARGGPSQQGAPSRDERLRAQRWLTYERNEWILASCMRLAGEMEHSMDTSKSTILHHAIDPSREIEVRTEHKTLERCGTAARFLRLAHRINMDQQKFLEKNDLPALEPLTLDVSEQSQATADAREGYQPATQVAPSGAGFQPAESFSPEPLAQRASEEKPLPTPDESPAATLEPLPSSPTHNPTPHASPLTRNPSTTSAENASSQNKNPPAYPVAPQPPKPTDPIAEILSAALHQPLPPINFLPVITPMFG